MATFSVVIPCYNHAGYLGETIQSVLAQTHPADEILVVDDGSLDGSAEVAEKYAAAHPAVRLLRQKNAGRSAAANYGLAESKGDFLVFLDADDRLLPHALASGLAQLEAHPEAAFAAGHCVHIDADGKPLETLGQEVLTEDAYAHLLEENFIWNPGNVLFRRGAVEAVGGFDTRLRHAEDYNIYLRITRNQPIVSYGEVVAEYRQHPNNKSKNAHTMLKTMLLIMNGESEFAGRTPRTRLAWQVGMQHTLTFYGDRCMDQLRRNLGPGGDRKKAWATFQVLSLCPSVPLRGLTKKLRR